MELLILLAVLFAGMWFMSNRARKQQRAAAAFRDHLEPGQEVMTGSGMYGYVVGVEGDVVILETSPGVETRWLKQAISKLVEPTEPVAEEAEYDDEAYDEDAEYEVEDDDAEGDEDEADEAEYDDEIVEDDEAVEDDDAEDPDADLTEDDRRS